MVVLLDSLTRLARVQNLAAPGGGRTLSGGMDASALTPLRQVFGEYRPHTGVDGQKLGLENDRVAALRARLDGPWNRPDDTSEPEDRHVV